MFQFPFSSLFLCFFMLLWGQKTLRSFVHRNQCKIGYGNERWVHWLVGWESGRKFYLIYSCCSSSDELLLQTRHWRRNTHRTERWAPFPKTFYFTDGMGITWASSVWPYFSGCLIAKGMAEPWSWCRNSVLQPILSLVSLKVPAGVSGWPHPSLGRKH